MQQLCGLRDELGTSTKLPEVYTKAERIINGLIDMCVTDLTQLKTRHMEHIGKYVSSHRKF
jgi:hypothetical protein